MRFLEVELESALPLVGIDPPLRDILSFAAPSPEDLVICDRPDGASPRLVRFREGSGPVAIPLDEPAFFPRLLADATDDRVLVVGAGKTANALLVSLDGQVLRRFSLGEEIADVGYDPDGNIVVLRVSRKNRRTLLDRFGPEGDRVVRDDQIERISSHTTFMNGTMLMIQDDGTLWLNLAEKYNVDGELLDVIEPAEVFGAGRVSSDLIGWDGIVVLSSQGTLTALLPRGVRKTIKLPEADIMTHLGRRLTAQYDVLATREEKMTVVATDKMIKLTFRILSE